MLAGGVEWSCWELKECNYSPSRVFKPVGKVWTQGVKMCGGGGVGCARWVQSHNCNWGGAMGLGAGWGYPWGQVWGGGPPKSSVVN